MLSTKIRKFISKRVSLFIITFLVVVSAVALAGVGQVLIWEATPSSWGIVATSRWEKVHNFVNWWIDVQWYALITSWALVVKWSQPTEKFAATVDSYTNYLAGLITNAQNLSDKYSKYRPALFVNGNATIRDNLIVWNRSQTAGKYNKTKLLVYWQIQLWTTPIDNWNRATGVDTASCSTGSIWTIRLTLPIDYPYSWSVCPLQICYPGGQWTNTGTSRKSACDLVQFNGATPTPPIRTEVWMEIEIPPVD